VSAAAILAEALKLPADERAELAEQLFASIDAGAKSVDDMDDDELLAELNRRRDASHRDPSQSIPADVFLANLRAAGG
jgi:putative addiction module component (TIGR02574 family)